MNLFGSGAAELVRVKDVVAEAGLTERYFYESFSDLDALFGAVSDIVIQDIETEVNAAVQKAPEDDLASVSIALRTSVEKLVGDPRMIQIIFAADPSRGGRAGLRRSETRLRAARTLLGRSGARGCSLGDNPEARIKALALSGAASELLISRAEGLLEITADELTDFLVGLYRQMNFP